MTCSQCKISTFGSVSISFSQVKEATPTLGTPFGIWRRDFPCLRATKNVYESRFYHRNNKASPSSGHPTLPFFSQHIVNCVPVTCIYYMEKNLIHNTSNESDTKNRIRNVDMMICRSSRNSEILPITVTKSPKLASTIISDPSCWSFQKQQSRQAVPSSTGKQISEKLKIHW